MAACLVISYKLITRHSPIYKLRYSDLSLSNDEERNTSALDAYSLIWLYLLLTCFTIRVIDLEVCQSLETDCFINALRHASLKGEESQWKYDVIMEPTMWGRETAASITPEMEPDPNWQILGISTCQRLSCGWMLGVHDPILALLLKEQIMDDKELIIMIYMAIINGRTLTTPVIWLYCRPINYWLRNCHINNLHGYFKRKINMFVRGGNRYSTFREGGP